MFQQELAGFSTHITAGLSDRLGMSLSINPKYRVTVMSKNIERLSALSVAIVGSIDSNRTDYDPPLRNLEQAQEAAEEIGQALAEAGCHIVVYSGAASFLEAHVVRGYVASGKAKEASIHVWHRVNHPAGRFVEQDRHEALFRSHPDASSSWEASFYRSLGEVDGVVLIGGGRSTLITGHIALGFNLPVLAVATFGGKAREVWGGLDSAELAAIRDERSVMAPNRWVPGSSAKACVDALLRMHEARRKRQSEALEDERERKRSMGRRAVLALALLVVTFSVLPVGWFVRALDNIWFLSLVFLSPILAGACGSTISMLRAAPQQLSTLGAVALGSTAGAVSAALYVIAQLAANPDLFESAPPPFLVLPYAVLIGFVAGLTFEQVYRRLEKHDALEPQSLIRTRG